MITVRESILEDAKFYIRRFNRTEWESQEEKIALPQLAKLFNDALPIDVTAWARVNEPKPDLIYGKGQGEQICFIRDIIARLFIKKSYKRTKVMVIATHMSKSVLLPVYEIRIPGLRITIEGNFYGYGCSIESDTKVDCDFMGLLGSKDASFLYGFPDDRKFKHHYSCNNEKFSFETNSNFDFYTIMFLLSQWYFK